MTTTSGNIATTPMGFLVNAPPPWPYDGSLPQTIPLKVISKRKRNRLRIGAENPAGKVSVAESVDMLDEASIAKMNRRKRDKEQKEVEKGKAERAAGKERDDYEGWWSKSMDSKEKDEKDWNKQVDKDTYVVTSKPLGMEKEKGKWRTVLGIRTFFPADGSPPSAPSLRKDFKPSGKSGAKSKPASGGGDSLDYVKIFNSTIEDFKKSGIDFAQSDDDIRNFTDDKLLQTKGNFEWNYGGDKVKSFAIMQDEEGKKFFTKWSDDRRSLIDGELKKRGLTYKEPPAFGEPKKQEPKADAAVPTVTKPPAAAVAQIKADAKPTQDEPKKDEPTQTVQAAPEKKADEKPAEKKAEPTSSAPTTAAADAKADSPKEPEAKADAEKAEPAADAEKPKKARKKKDADEPEGAAEVKKGRKKSAKAASSAPSDPEDFKDWSSQKAAKELLSDLKKLQKRLQTKSGKKVSRMVKWAVSMMIKGIETKSPKQFKFGQRILGWNVPTAKMEEMEGVEIVEGLVIF